MAADNTGQQNFRSCTVRDDSLYKLWECSNKSEGRGAGGTKTENLL